jgi:putative SOS response-associated peptidase YedK
MPVILDKKDENLWLNGNDIFNSDLSEQIEYYPVRKIVNSPRNNSTECIDQESI